MEKLNTIHKHPFLHNEVWNIFTVTGFLPLINKSKYPKFSRKYYKWSKTKLFNLVSLAFDTSRHGLLRMSPRAVGAQAIKLTVFYSGMKYWIPGKPKWETTVISMSLSDFFLPRFLSPTIHFSDTSLLQVLYFHESISFTANNTFLWHVNLSTCDIKQVDADSLITYMATLPTDRTSLSVVRHSLCSPPPTQQWK